jgi:glycosyltransferase involved in cell wall biosynthesis
VIKRLVSIIIPTYNRADSVVEAIHSAKAQTYPLKQIIVVDDGSTDDTASRVAEIEGVEYFYQENRRQGDARNQGLRLAKGEYIASLDSDDLWEEDFLSRSVECLESLNLDFVFTNWVKLRGDQTHISEWLRDGKWKPYQAHRQGEWSLLDSAQIRKLFLEICPAPSSSLLLRRNSIVSGWGEHMRIADEWYLVLEMALHHRCKAAFSLTPRWKKRVDGKNVYDGQPYIESVKNLYLHDYQIFGRDFGKQLTRLEKLMLARRGMKYRLRLLLHDAVRFDLVARIRQAVNGPALAADE